MTVKIWEWDHKENGPTEVEVKELRGEGLRQIAISLAGRPLMFGMARCKTRKNMLECRQITLLTQHSDFASKVMSASKQLFTFNEKWADEIETLKKSSAEFTELFE